MDVKTSVHHLVLLEVLHGTAQLASPGIWLLREQMQVKGRAGRAAVGSTKVVGKRRHPRAMKRCCPPLVGHLLQHLPAMPQILFPCPASASGLSCQERARAVLLAPRIKLLGLGWGTAHLKGTVPMPCASLPLRPT